MTMALWIAGGSVVEVTLGTAVERQNFVARIYKNAFDEEEDTEIQIANAVTKYLANLCGDIDLGATVRCIDIAGMYGDGINVKAGYGDLGGKIYRMFDINFGVVVDDELELIAS